MKRFVITVRNKNGNAPIGFDGVFLDADCIEDAKSIALTDVSDSVGVPVEQLVFSGYERS
jgi:hypothetical protein